MVQWRWERAVTGERRSGSFHGRHRMRRPTDRLNRKSSFGSGRAAQTLESRPSSMAAAASRRGGCQGRRHRGLLLKSSVGERGPGRSADPSQSTDTHLFGVGIVARRATTSLFHA
uniref:Uncharacterized protein n=1 Tax=Plectus sambesii TaxID=2011161 RepID=A0A914WL66_9BILA